MTKTDVQKKAVVEALEKCLGIESHACKMAGVSRDAYYRWKRIDEKFAQAVAGIAELAVDFAESQLFKKIKDGDTTAIIFFLKTKGKKRGYVERSELQTDFPGKQTVTVKIIRGDIATA